MFEKITENDLCRTSHVIENCYSCIHWFLLFKKNTKGRIYRKIYREYTIWKEDKNTQLYKIEKSKLVLEGKDWYKQNCLKNGFITRIVWCHMITIKFRMLIWFEKPSCVPTQKKKKIMVNTSNLQIVKKRCQDHLQPALCNLINYW